MSRDALVRAFEAAGERLTLEFDLAKADPGSPIDAYYVGAGGARSDTGFGPVLLEDDDDVPEHMAGVRRISFGRADVVSHRNVVLGFSAGMKPARREQLVAILESV